MKIVQEQERSEEMLDVVRAGMRRNTESRVKWEEYTISLSLRATMRAR